MQLPGLGTRRAGGGWRARRGPAHGGAARGGGTRTGRRPRLRLGGPGLYFRGTDPMGPGSPGRGRAGARGAGAAFVRGSRGHRASAGFRRVAPPRPLRAASPSRADRGRRGENSLLHVPAPLAGTRGARGEKPEKGGGSWRRRAGLRDQMVGPARPGPPATGKQRPADRVSAPGLGTPSGSRIRPQAPLMFFPPRS